MSQTKDKKYIENLLRRYKRNKARLSILEKGLVSDEDNILGAIDYTSKLKMGNIQTSNVNSLDNKIERREKEKEKLIEDITLTEILLESLTERDYMLIYNYYIERKTLVRIAQMLDRDDTKTIWRNKSRIINELEELLEDVCS